MGYFLGILSLVLIRFHSSCQMKTRRELHVCVSITTRLLSLHLVVSKLTIRAWLQSMNVTQA